MGKTIDIFSGESLSKVEERLDEERIARVEKLLEVFDVSAKLYRELIADGEVGSVALVCISGGVLASPPLVLVDEPTSILPLAVALRNLSEQVSDHAVMSIQPVTEDYSDYDEDID